MTKARRKAVAKYNHSEKARAAQQRYRATPAYKIVRFIIGLNPKRKLHDRLYHQRRKANECSLPA